MMQRWFYLLDKKSIQHDAVSNNAISDTSCIKQPRLPWGKWVLSFGQYRILIERRAMLVALGLFLTLLATMVFSLSVGSAKLTAVMALKALWGESTPLVDLMVFNIRLPRVFAVVVAGAALGISGCLIQTLVRNRLATPDMIGVNEGATLAITCFTLYSSMGSWPWWAAPFGALVAAGLLYAMCRRPGEQSYLFVVIGIGISELMRAIGELLLSTEAIVHVSSVYLWSMGNFVGQGWSTTLPIALLLLILLPAVFYFSRDLQLLRLGPDIAKSLGVATNRVQLGTLLLAILIAALGTAIGGPIVFIAMAAPIIASYSVKNRVVPLVHAALLGALLLLLSDTLVRILASPHEVATGIMTRILGGIMLLVLLLTDKQGRE